MVKNARLQVQTQVSSGGLLDAAFIDRVTEAGFDYYKQIQYPTSTKDLQAAYSAEIVSFMHMGWSQSALIETNNVYALIGLQNGHVEAKFAGSEADVTALIEDMKQRVPEVDRDDPNQVLVTFWALGQHGPFSIERQIVVPGWDDIRDHYSAEIQPEMDRLMGDFKPSHGGQLILWHGEPGTGKTYALRAMAREWRSWADIHYIVDPEKFFGQEAAYLVQVLSGEETFDDEEEEKARARWRLLVFEDTGELISADASLRSGQGLSRFLNVVDGLIGQGMRVMLLVTTNEELGKLHPAVARPGRCASRVLFPPLSANEARDLLIQHGVGGQHLVQRPTPLADVFQLIESNSKVAAPEHRAIGFAPRDVKSA